MKQATGENGRAALQKRRLVQATAAKMRDLILDQEPDTQIGSLPELAKLLGVGVVTVQQAARILEYEGLLAVRRGPGGGYYGARPDEATLERLIAAYMRVHGPAYIEALDLSSLLNCELVAAAAACADSRLHDELRALVPRIEVSDTEDQRLVFEEELVDVLFRMVDRPVIKLLTRVTIRLSKSTPSPRIYRGEDGTANWRASRYRLIGAVLQRDEELARFEAMRNRRYLMRMLREQRAGDPVDQPGA